ncbi:MAG: M13 family metallopeptidase [Crocinitomicaceae bacterium]
MKKQYLILTALTASLLVSCGGEKKEEEKGKGETKEEAKAAPMKNELSYMDSTIRPQEDFFLFCNNNWIKNNPVPSTESRWGSFNELDEANRAKLRVILEEVAANPGEKGSYNQIVGDYYNSFMNMEKRNELGITPIKEELAVVDGITDKESLVAAITKLHAMGVGTMFGMGVDLDLKNPNINVLNADQGGLNLPNKSFYVDKAKEEIRNEYVMHIDKMFDLAGLGKGKGQDVLNFETKIAQVCKSQEEQRIPELSYNKYSKADFAALSPSFSWDAYYEANEIGVFDTLIVGTPKYFEGMEALISKEPIETWKNYLNWCVINNYSDALTQEFLDQDFAFYSTVLKGQKEMKEDWKRAIGDLTHNYISEALGKLFVERHFSENAKNKVNVMVDNIMAAFKERLNDLEWMSVETKERALHKLESFGRKLGFPEEWKDFSGIDISADAYAQNVKNINLFAKKENAEKLGKPKDPKEWGMPPHMVNAYYHPLFNEIVFPAGIMQPPFFDEHASDAVNYGRMGMVIGHEFTHGFDDMGSKFAADGSFSNWWSEEDLEKFKERTEKLGNTYAQFCPFDDVCVQPQMTMGENIADLGGITLAYYAYLKTDEYKKGEKVNGFTPDQEFFIAVAQLWKINYTDEELKNRIATDYHSPGMYRVNGPLKNCPEFWQAFDVKEGDPMRNPSDQAAKIW